MPTAIPMPELYDDYIANTPEDRVPPDEFFDKINPDDLPVSEWREQACTQLADLMKFVLDEKPETYDQWTWGTKDVQVSEMACNTSHCLAGFHAGAILNLHPTCSTFKEQRLQQEGVEVVDMVRFEWGTVATEPFQNIYDKNAPQFSIMWMGYALGLNYLEADALFDEQWWASDIPQALRDIGMGDDPSEVRQNKCEYGACGHDDH